MVTSSSSSMSSSDSIPSAVKYIRVPSSVMDSTNEDNSQQHLDLSKNKPNITSHHNSDKIKLTNSSLLATESRIYRDAASTIDASFIDYDSMLLSKLNWTSQDDIKIVRYIDSGRFSSVFEGRMRVRKGVGIINELGMSDDEYISDAKIRENGEEFHINNQVDNEDSLDTDSDTNEISVVLKVLKPTFVGKIKREMKILQLLRGTKGVIRLLGVAKNAGCQTITLIFESLGKSAHWLSHSAVPLSSHQVELLSYKLLQALDQCHSKGVMHRDVKPRNVICHRRTGELRLIDFGLSDFYIPHKEYNPNVASRHYKGPELLFGYLHYDYSVDIWSAGCLIAGLIFDSEPFLYGADALDQISCVASVVGSQEILTWADKYRLKLSPDLKKAIGKYPRIPLEEFRNEQNCHLCTPLAIDLVSKMLVVDHQNRLTAQQCLAHPYFDRVRAMLNEAGGNDDEETAQSQS